MRYPATAALTLILVFALSGCSDPQHGAWKVKSGVWLIVASFAALVFAASVTTVLLRCRRDRLDDMTAPWWIK